MSDPIREAFVYDRTWEGHPPEYESDEGFAYEYFERGWQAALAWRERAIVESIGVDPWEPVHDAQFTITDTFADKLTDSFNQEHDRGAD